jgi:hypothetical protein
VESKKRVGYSIFALGIVRLAFSLAQHLAGHEVTVMEVFEALPFLSAGVVLYATDVHKILVSVSQTMYKSVELNIFDGFQYAVAKLITSFSRHFRKTHTGVLSYNMLMAFIGAALLLLLLALFA